jgi:hypothetical protein
VSEEIAKQSTEVTNSIIRSVGIFNQLGVTALDSARENVKIYGRTVDALTDFNNNILKAWTSYWSSITTTATRANEVNDIVRDNTLRIVDEVAKVQPQFAQSISNLQLDNIQTVRSMIQTVFANQKQVVAHALNTPQALQVSEEVAKQSTEVTNSIIRSVGIFNQLGVTALDSARESVKIYGRTVDALTDFNNNILKAWTSYWSSPQQQQLQQQFYRA